ncbi:hypothetical protein [Methylophilus aquaticus]|uniref:Uncharacterized protein n=1 Tax=Methylophilus aquaticus TaxID=1971610 RepID=A0ABT9JYK4_9PROT|nr:hypothetical protein [Methylophilus aquaticus]MDP8568961.1 hypothetical protein [Methylophilus aquaticus]
MQAETFLEKSRSPQAWRKHSRALRRSANVLYDDFVAVLTESIKEAKALGVDTDHERAIEAIETAKLLYGLALETALKAWIIEHTPGQIEIKITIDGSGEAKHAELKSFGVNGNQGHNLSALADVAGIFDEGTFGHVLKTDSDRDVFRAICRDLGQVVVWRGRYPVPMASFEPQPLAKGVPWRVYVHYMRDWLDPMLDALLAESISHEQSNS